MTIQSSLFGSMRAQQAAAAKAGPQVIDFDAQFLRFESMMNHLNRVKTVHAAACKGSMSVEESRFSQHTLNSVPYEFQPDSIRMEGYANTSEGLKYRAEGIIDSIINGIASFFRWIGEAFSKLFGGGGGDSSSSGGGAEGATAAATETSTAISESGADEFLFKESHPLFKMMDLQRLDKCREYYTAIASSTKALVEIQKKAIELSKKANAEYQGDFAKDVVGELKGFASGKTHAFAKANLGSETKSEDVFAYPVSFLKSRVIVFGETSISTPNETGSDDKTGEGYTPKDVYIKASEYKGLVDHFAQNGKMFYDALDDIKKLSEGYKGLEEMVRGWTKIEPEEAKKVGNGIKELNKIASFVVKAIKQQKSGTDRLFKTLRDVAENDLRDAAKAGRSKEDEEAKKKAQQVSTEGAAVESPIP